MGDGRAVAALRRRLAAAVSLDRAGSARANDAGQIVINLCASAGTRIERAEKLTQRIEKELEEVIPADDRQMIVTDMDVLYDWPAGYTANSGLMDAMVLMFLDHLRQR